MGIRYDDLNDIPPAIRAQVELQLKKSTKQHARQRLPSAPPAPCDVLDQMDSLAERDFYLAEVWPKLQSGLVMDCELHKTFILLPASEYCGIRLPAARYTVDFFLTYANGHIEAVEVKHKVIRKLQRDYIYRRRLFIDIHARPNGWGFREILRE